jgi:L-ribulokinase
VIEPDRAEQAVYERLYRLYRSLYFSLGDPASGAVQIGQVLPELRTIAASVRS